MLLCNRSSKTIQYRKELGMRKIFFTFLMVGLLAFCSGCSTTPRQTILSSPQQLLQDVPPGSVMITNLSDYTLLLSKNGMPWTYSDGHQRSIGPRRSVVLEDCTTNEMDEISIEMKAFRIGQLGCIPFKDYVGSTTCSVHIGHASVPIVVTVKSWNIR